ncbi:CoA transferase [Kocuria sp.]|uniref:CoA transferase n=1 Tax=Kocuria sp. TaxID=1871328 RepID=UPI0026E003A7|nr:CoA transferase [Kocuria sp.]MDO5618104.1 CoA transferase [Kocuria sp.]
MTGFQRVWDGPLAVEQLAVQSVEAVTQALGRLTDSTDRYTVSAPATFAAFDSLGHLRIAGRRPEGFAPLSGFWRTRDGWLRTHGNYPHHARRLLSSLGLDPHLPDDDAAAHLVPVLSALAGADAEARIQAAGGIAARVRTPDEWAESVMARVVAGEPWIKLEPLLERSATTASTATPPATTSTLPAMNPAATGPTTAAVSTRSWAPSDDPRYPLTGLRVLDFTRVIAGPIATRLLGALGADVLRIDPPGMPELLDQQIDAGFDKRSTYADLTDPQVKARVMELVGTADVVVMGYRPRALAKFGLEPAALLATFPHLVVAELNAWGTRGPWGELRGFDSIVQAASGIAWMYRDHNARPGALPCQALDHATGYGIAAGVLGLLARRRESGCGGRVHLSLARTATELMRLSAPKAAVETVAEPKTAAAPVPKLLHKNSAFGVLEYVPPPLMIGGEPLDYRQPPAYPGAAELAWE